MKSPEYVYETARVWRRLLDERRPATREELSLLATAFSRGGFTDGYYTERIDRKMLGIRSEDDKAVSRQMEPFAGLRRRLTLNANARILRATPISLTLSDHTRSVTVTGEEPLEAINAPLTHDSAKRSLTKFGGTAYEIGNFTLELDDGLMVPVSKLNELRRRALGALEEAAGLTAN